MLEADMRERPAEESAAPLFQDPSVEIERRDDGVLILRCGQPLEDHPPSVLAWLRHWAERRPGQTLLAQRDAGGAWQRVSYADALASVRSIATVLRQMGGSQERPLVILSENSIENALMTWGAMYAGVPVAPISPAYSTAQGELRRLQAAVELVQPWLVFAQDGARYARALDVVAKTAGLPASRMIVVSSPPLGTVLFDAVARTPPAADADEVHDRIDRSLPAKYMFTSGSTGVPKAVLMTHGMLAAAQQNSAQILARPPRDPMVQIDWLPWHHVMGGNVVLHRLLRFGGTLYLDEGRPLPGRFEQTLANLREIAPSYYFNVPAGYAMLADAFERDPAFARHVLERLEFTYFAGAALPEDVHARLQAVALRILGRRIVVGTAFGSTETTAAVTMRTWQTSETAGVGLPLPGNELKLVPDPDMPGRYELRARGPVVFERYLHAAERTAEAFDAEGFYSLGDAVRFLDPHKPSEGLLFAGRFAEDFKLSNGTWVRTAPLRAALLNAGAPLLKDAVIVGEGREHVSALVWLDAAACRSALGLPAATGMAALVRHEAVLAALGQALAAANAGATAASMRVERLLALEEAPSSEAYELTDKGSINQRAVVQRRSEAVTALYAQSARPGVVRPAA